MKKLRLIILVNLLVLQALYLASPSTVQAEEMTCEPHRSVEVDIKPDDDPNQINLSARGLLPVAVLTTQQFDASLFTPEMAHLSDAALAMGCAGAEAIRWNHDDVNGDGELDLVFFFRVQDLNLTSDSTAAILMAHGSYDSTDIHIMGTDPVLVKP